MNEAETTTMETEKTPNRIEGSDLERKAGGADMKTAGGDFSLSGGGMEQVRSDVGDGVPDVPSDNDGTASESPAFVAEDAAIRAHFDRLWQEAESFSAAVPGFDLAHELQDDAFAALLSPRRGLTLEQAYFVRHGRELLAAAERAAEQRLSAALQASRRVPAPLESAASAGFRWDPGASAEARAALKARIRKGEKIYPHG